MKKKIIAALILSQLTIVPVWAQVTATPASPTTTEVPGPQPVFSDVPATQVNYVAIKFLKENGVLNGYSDGSFKPANPVNRAEALKILLVGNGIDVPDKVESSSFPDVSPSEWYAVFVEKSKTIGIIRGNDDGTFAPVRNVSRAEFFKMLLILNNFLTDKWVGKQLYYDVPADAWFTPYLNYAGQAGLLTADDQNNLFPARELNRGEVVEIMYLLLAILNNKNTAFLVGQTEAQLSQIEVYMADNNLVSAKRASDLAVDMSQQAILAAPEDKVVLGAAKIARSYNFLLNSYLSALQKDYPAATDWANQSIAKADEAIEVNVEVQAIATHVKNRANELLAQFPGG